MNKKYKLAFILTIIVLLVISSMVYANNKRISGKDLGKQVNQAYFDNIDEDGILCYVDGMEIRKKDFNVFKATSNSYGEIKADDVLLKEYIKTRLVINEAEKAGMVATEEEVEDYTNFLFDSFDEDDENYKILKEYAEEMGMTMDEYKEQVKEYNYKVLITMKLQEKLLSDRKQETHNLDVSEYLSQYKEDLYNKAEIIFNK